MILLAIDECLQINSTILITFFQSIHSTFISNYTEAEEHYKLAEKILVAIPDEIEHAELL
ncbi:hypothetical protein CW304_10365 [Bacillus sp. UFRGS-B20]|nr:hypothetical protein CW304_10365 [Bacillus sp. UFRGS-B20]